MPFTPFHIGPTLMFGLLFFSWLDFSTLIVASFAQDIEPAIAIIFRLSYPWYGWFHHIEGSIVTIILVAVVLYTTRIHIRSVMARLGLYQESSFKKIFLTSIFGVCIHLAFDAPPHARLELNVIPLELTIIEAAIYVFSILSLFTSFVLYKRKIKNKTYHLNEQTKRPNK
ncbi:MAG: hypothetical protein KGD61_11015 [Candidatus Lokiarchaeota archaeon]|nr:hypothetical protein [Candidatus Lokiarchaeota archaeon]